MSPRCFCDTAKRTRIGRIWLITTRGSGEFARTRLPSRTSKRPVRPAIGARIPAHSRLRRAVATAAEAARTTALSASAPAPLSFLTPLLPQFPLSPPPAPPPPAPAPLAPPPSRPGHPP